MTLKRETAPPAGAADSWRLHLGPQTPLVLKHPRTHQKMLNNWQERCRSSRPSGAFSAQLSHQKDLGPASPLRLNPGMVTRFVTGPQRRSSLKEIRSNPPRPSLNREAGCISRIFLQNRTPFVHLRPATFLKTRIITMVPSPSISVGILRAKADFARGVTLKKLHEVPELRRRLGPPPELPRVLKVT